MKTRAFLTLLLAAAPLARAAAQAPAGHEGEAPAAPVAGSVSGSVRQLNVARGTITVQAGQGTVTLNADPGQLAPLAVGDRVAFPYASYDGALWLPPQATRGEIGRFPMREEGKLAGTIQRLQRAQGTVTVRRVTFRVHPSRLEGLEPGRRVALTFGLVGKTIWIAELRPLAARPPPPPPEPAPDEAAPNAGDVGSSTAPSASGADRSPAEASGSVEPPRP